MFGFDDRTIGSSRMAAQTSMFESGSCVSFGASELAVFAGPAVFFGAEGPGILKEHPRAKAYQVTGLVRVDVPPIEGANQVIQSPCEIDNGVAAASNACPHGQDDGHDAASGWQR
jgi:hypothetical protein